MTPDHRARARLRGLDGLRFLAAALVVGYHYTGVGTGFWGTTPNEVFPTLNEVTRYGYLGVEMFFMISGFVILMTAYDRPVDRFVASRVARLFPAYWVAVVLTVALQEVWHGGRQLTWQEALLNLTMTQEAFDVTNAQGAFWTLWPELKFYLLIGVFVVVGITRHRVIAFAVLWPVVAQLAAATDSGMLNSLLIPTYAPYFALGILLFLVHRDGNDAVVWLGIALNLVLCVNQAAGYAPRASENVGAPVSATVTSLLVVAMAASVWALTCTPLRNLGWRWLTVAGALTYPLYLVHGQFGFAVIDTLHGRYSAYLVLALAVVVSLVLATAIHYLVERPWHDRLRDAVARGLARRRKDGPDGTPAGSDGASDVVSKNRVPSTHPAP